MKQEREDEIRGIEDRESADPFGRVHVSCVTDLLAALDSSRASHTALRMCVEAFLRQHDPLCGDDYLRTERREVRLLLDAALYRRLV